MLTKRIIPCLDVKHGRIVKGVQFQGLRDAGAPDERAQLYETHGADEIVLLDVSATPEGRGNQLETVEKVRAKLSIPLTVGGGVRKAQDAGALLMAGADKVAVNTAAVLRPKLISELASRFGSQCTVVAIDAKGDGAGGWYVVVRSGEQRVEMDAIEWAKMAVDLGAGELLLTSWDRDGTRSGYDLPLLKLVSDVVNVPVIASGGAHTPAHMIEALDAGADAVLAASIFHDGDYTVDQLKHILRAHNIEVRL